MSLSKRLMATFVGLLVMLATLVHATSADACSCAQKPPASEDFARSTRVFEAKVVSSKSTPPRLKTTLHVIRGWKGVAAGSQDIVVDQDTLCGFGFELGKTYVVYASEDSGAVSVSLCSRTTASDIAAERVKLDAIAKSAPVAPAASSSSSSPSPSSAPTTPATTSAPPVAADTAKAPVPSASPAGVPPVPPPAKSGCSASPVEPHSGFLTLGLLAVVSAVVGRRRVRP